MRFHARLAALIAVVLMLVALPAQTQAAPPPPPSPITLSGTVSFGSDGAHPSGVIGSVSARWASSTSYETTSVQTDAAGAYSLTVPANKVIYLYFESVQPGWLPAYYTDPQRGTGYVVAGTTSITGVNQTLLPATTIGGTVYLGSTATPAGAGEVTVRYSRLSNYSWYDGTATTTTDGNGNYVIQGLEQGQYRVLFDYAGDEYADQWASTSYVYVANRANIITVGADGVTGIDGVLAPGASVSGVVTDGSGAPITGLVVSARGLYWTDSQDQYSSDYSAVTDSNGHYSIGGLPASIRWAVRFVPPSNALYTERRTDVALASGESATVDMQIYRDVYVSGYVQCAGCDGLSNGPRSTMVASLERRASATSAWSEVRTAPVSDGSGYFALQGIEPGDYRVTITYLETGSYAPHTRSAVFTLPEGQSYNVGNLTVGKYANPIAALYAELGGSKGALGAASGAITAVSGGKLQAFAKGTIFWQKNNQAHAVIWSDPIGAAYKAAGAQAGRYGWPTGDRTCESGTCTQAFRHGTITATTIVATAPPTVTGSAIVGGALTAKPGTYSPSATKYTYAWYRDGARIPGASSSKYVPVVADFGHTLTATVTASRSGKYPITTSSAPTPAIGPALQKSTSKPKITGTAKVGSTLTAVPGTWATGTDLTYQWTAAGAAIPDATAPTFTPGPLQWGKTITVKVTGTHPDYSPTTRTSAATVPIAATAFSSAPAPTISGTPQVGIPLDALTGTWEPAAAFTYQWSANGKAISGAKAATFTPTAAQLGKKLTVAVTGKASGYVTATRTSPSSAPVAP